MKDPIKEHRADLLGEDSEALRAPPKSPVYFLSIVAISIILIEAFVMILLSQIQHPSLLVTVLIDSTLLILLLSPVLYLFLYRPHIQHINRQRRIETTLLKSEEKYRTLVDVSPVGIFHTDVRGEVTYINKEGLRIADLTPEEAYSGKERWAKSLHPEDRERVMSEWNQTVKDQIDFKSEYRFQRKDGKFSWVIGHSTVLKDSSGQVLGFMGTLSDITDRKEVEESIRESEEKLRTITSSTSDAIMMIDNKGTISFWNDAAESMLGYKRHEALDKDIHELIVPQRYHDAMKKGLEKFAETGEGEALGKVLVLPAVRKGGEEFFAEHSLTGVRLKDKWHSIGIIRDITGRIQAEKELLEAATRERLTGLLNRFSFEKDEKTMKNPALILIDIDGFRHVNDLYGAEAGNSVLKDLSRYLESIPPENLNAKVYKLGGDDFGILFENNPEYHPMDLAKKIVVEGSNRDFVYEGNAISINLSAGISRERPLLEKADMVLNYLRRHTRVKYLEYNDTLTLKKNISENMKMLNILKTAINRNGIVSYFQPIVNNKTGRIEKYECLVRIIDEGGQVLSPFSFLQVAKEARLYGEITRRMIERGIAAFRDNDYEFSINISVEDIHDREVEEFMAEILKNNPEIARRTTFEIIESEGIENYEIAYAFVKKVKEYGCKIAIDDFGAGYSNFGHTMRLDIDYIKIDSSLIKEIDRNEKLQILTETIVNYAQRLGIETIAEYVHSKEVHEKVIELGVDYSQGYYIGEPKPTIEGCG
ncbi:MAG: EAL domain-containing protein [Nitrospirae bacterium]|nr:EAL domain-containing protein [Nitrospirota bacterium]